MVDYRYKVGDAVRIKESADCLESMKGKLGTVAQYEEGAEGERLPYPYRVEVGADSEIFAEEELEPAPGQNTDSHDYHVGYCHGYENRGIGKFGGDYAAGYTAGAYKRHANEVANLLAVFN